ncbi:MAG: stalk domain-containing protein [Syntrophomonas sp.]
MLKNRTMRSAKLGILCILTLLISLLAPFYATAVSIPFNITVPIGGESLTVGNQMYIQWQPVSQYAGLQCNLDYSTNGGATWTPISTGIDFSSGLFNWTIPNTPTTNAVIRISLDVPVPLVGGTIHVEQKSGVFSIIPSNPDKPAAPTNLTATVISSTQVNLSWKDNSTNETKFTIIRKSIGANEVIASLAANVTSYQDKNLSPNTSYIYRVIAMNDAGDSLSGEATAKTKSDSYTDDSPPAAPSNLSATAISSSQINLSWQANTGAMGFVIKRKSAGDYEDIADLLPNVTSYQNKNLSPDTSYTYIVMAWNNCGKANSNEASAKTSSSSKLPNNSTGSNQMRFYIGNTNYYVNSQLKSMDAAPQIYESRTVLPIGYVVEPMGAAIDWNQAAQKVTIKLNGKQIELTIGNSYAQVNGVSKPIDANNSNVKPVILPPGRTMMPLSFIMTELGCGVKWDGTTQEVKITY